MRRADVRTSPPRAREAAAGDCGGRERSAVLPPPAACRACNRICSARTALCSALSSSASLRHASASDSARAAAAWDVCALSVSVRVASMARKPAH
eukprot:3069044-Prymnesium_polylepis.1